MVTEQWRNKNKDDPQQKWHLEKYECDKQRDHNIDNPYALDYTQEKHTQQTEQLTWYVHGREEEHSMYIQKHEGGHNLEQTHVRLLQGTFPEGEMKVED